MLSRSRSPTAAGANAAASAVAVAPEAAVDRSALEAIKKLLSSSGVGPGSEAIENRARL